jgi:hypothetical protein
MARISGIGNSLIDGILPIYGNPRTNTPIWNESQHMFITEQHTSAAGNTYYLGVRFSDRFVTILHIGLFHNWTYINDVEVYAFDDQERKLIGKTTLDQFYNEDLVRATTEKLLKDYLEGQIMIQGGKVDSNMLDHQVKELVDKSYISMLNDENTMRRLEAVKPLLIANK